MAASITDVAWELGTERARNEPSFVASDLLHRLDEMTAPELDALPFGAIRLDDVGVVVSYNRRESEIAGLDPADVIGKHFFKQIAPCTNNEMFRGPFDRGIHERRMDLLFDFTFTYRLDPTEVRIHLHRSGNSNWILVQPLGELRGVT
ncbi:MAG: PAS domain-containing protein [Actinomycetota bacterium]